MYADQTDSPGKNIPAMTPTTYNDQDISKWSKDHISIYDNLMREKQNLEKAYHSLDMTERLSEIERALLFHDDLDYTGSVFKSQDSGNYLYAGARRCLLREDEQDQSCSHEVCARAHTTGLSWKELSTIRNYDMRIVSAKSDRRKDALFKQRDVELTRVRTEDQEFQVSVNRRMAEHLQATGVSGVSRSKSDATSSVQVKQLSEEEQVLQISKRVRKQLDDLRASSFELTSSFSPGVNIPREFQRNELDALGKALGVRLSEDEECTLPLSSPYKLLTFFALIKTSELIPTLEVLGDILSFGSESSNILQEPLNSLTELFTELSNYVLLPGFTADENITTGVMLQLIIECLTSNNQAIVDNPTLKNHRIIKELEHCIEIEHLALKEIDNAFIESVREGRDASDDMKAIKDKTVTMSRIPLVTEQALECEVRKLMDSRTVSDLGKRMSIDEDDARVAGWLTANTIFACKSDIGQYLGYLDGLLEALVMVQQHTKNFKPEKCEIVHNVINKVRTSMELFIIKQQKEATDTTRELADRMRLSFSQGCSLSQNNGTSPSDNNKLYEAVMNNAKRLVHELSRPKSTPKLLSQAIKDSLRRNPIRGVWEQFIVFSQICYHSRSIRVNRESFRQLSFCVRRYQTSRLKNEKSVFTMIKYLHARGHCPASSACAILIALSRLAIHYPKVARARMNEFAKSAKDFAQEWPNAWSRTCFEVALAASKLYVWASIETMGLFGYTAVHTIALSIVTIVSCYVLMAQDASKASDNLQCLSDFLYLVFHSEKNIVAQELVKTLLRQFTPFVTNGRYGCWSSVCCSTLQSCKSSLQLGSTDWLSQNLRRFETRIHLHPARKEYQAATLTSEISSSRLFSKDLDIMDTLMQLVPLDTRFLKKALLFCEIRLGLIERNEVESRWGLLHAIDSFITFFVEPALSDEERGPLYAINDVNANTSCALNKQDDLQKNENADLDFLSDAFSQSPDEDILGLIEDVKTDAMRGSDTSAINFFDRRFDTLASNYRISAETTLKIDQARQELLRDMEKPELRSRWINNRFDYLLQQSGATEPSVVAFSTMALAKNSAFDEYMSHLVWELSYQGIEPVSIEQEISKIVELAEKNQLDENCEALRLISNLAYAIWLHSSRMRSVFGGVDEKNFIGNGSVETPRQDDEGKRPTLSRQTTISDKQVDDLIHRAFEDVKQRLSSISSLSVEQMSPEICHSIFKDLHTILPPELLLISSSNSNDTITAVAVDIKSETPVVEKSSDMINTVPMVIQSQPILVYPQAEHQADTTTEVKEITGEERQYIFIQQLEKFVKNIGSFRESCQDLQAHPQAPSSDVDGIRKQLDLLASRCLDISHVLADANQLEKVDGWLNENPMR